MNNVNNPIDQAGGLVTRGALDEALAKFKGDLTSGRILLPQVIPATTIFAGAVNHAPNSDHSYSTAAATVPGTLPGDAGDTNYEDYRYRRQQVGANVTVDAAHALKAEGHSLYGANEGADSAIPDWDRENGWARMGAAGAVQYDVALQLLGKIVGPGQRWFFLCRLGALAADIISPDVEFYAGVWIKAGAYEGWAKGDPFNLSYRIHGTRGSLNLNYRVLAETDSGVSILSNVLNVPDAPDVLSSENYPVIFFNAGPGFIKFTIVRENAGAYAKLYEIRNSTDLQYNDVGTDKGAVTGWPVDPGNAPLALARTRTLIVGPYGSTWALNQLTIPIPSTFNFSLVDVDGMFLRFGFSAPTAVDRQIGVDRLMFSTQFGEWAPDVLPAFADGTFPIPTISPTSGPQGGSDGVLDPPGDGTGGGLCIRTSMPVLVREPRSRRHAAGRFKRFKQISYSDWIPGEHRAPYLIQEISTGTSSEYYVLKTANGIRYECNARHELMIDIPTRQTIQAQQVVAGETKLASWVKGRKTKTLVIAKTLVPRPTEVGTLTLHHPQGLSRSGRGMYVAGFSRYNDRGLFCSNLKRGDFGEPNPN
jgi:hypothetical protein